MNRREALAALTTIIGGTIFGADRLLAGIVNSTAPSRVLTTAHLALLNEVAETIIPTTANSPGAKAAHVAAFMQEIARDYYDEREFAAFASAPEQFEKASAAMFAGRGFVALNPQERFDLLMSLENTKPQPQYYRMIKQLTVWGYFTSEIGMTKALNHVAVPGRYEACITVTPETKAWSQ